MESELRQRDQTGESSRGQLIGRTVAAIIAAYNEQGSLEATIVSLLDQTRPPDSVFVVVNNSTDQTFDVARRFNGRHHLNRGNLRYTCTITVLDIGVNDDKKPGALNLAWSLAKRHDYFLGVDADTILEPTCLGDLLDEIVADEKLGGVSAILSLDQGSATGAMAEFLVRAQRFAFTAETLRNLARSRRVPILGGQCSLFRRSALSDVARRFERQAPWVPESEVEDARLTADLLDIGYAARMSLSARAITGAMVTPRSLRAQQMKWTAGDIRLSLNQSLAAGVVRRAETRTGLLSHIASRVLLVLFVAGSLAGGSLAFEWWWIVPPMLSVLANARIALSMSRRSGADILYALAYLPDEIYRTVRSVTHVTAWIQVLGRRECDRWTAQASAEREGRTRRLSAAADAQGPAIISLCILLATVAIWAALPESARDALLTGTGILLIALFAAQSLAHLALIVRAPSGRSA